MDRWGQDGDSLDSPRQRGRGPWVRAGLGGFVKEKASGSEVKGSEIGASKVEVVPSRKVQKELQKEVERKKGVPMPMLQAAHPTAANPQGKDTTCKLEVHKDGCKIQNIEVKKDLTVIGRHPTADLVLDHGSVSRQHASLFFNPQTNSWWLEDLGSVHGTFLGGERLNKGNQKELSDGSVVKFGASTRTYVAKTSTSRKRRIQEGSGGAKRQRVRFADDDSEGRLEQVIGFSDGGTFGVNVGPRPAGEGERGQFETPLPISEERKLSQNRSSPPRPAVSSKLQLAIDNARKQADRKGTAGGGLYDEIPPSKDIAK